MQAQIRDKIGKKVKSLRQRGSIPAVLYGWKEKGGQPLSVDFKKFMKIWEEVGESGLIDLKVGGKNKNVLIQDVQLDPLNNKPMHVDFYAVDMEKPVETGVPLVFIGEPPAQKKGGILVKVMHEVEIKALPKDLISEIKVDVSGLADFEDRLSIKDLSLPAGVEINAEPDEVIVLIEEPKEEEEPKEAPSMEDIEVVGKGKEEAKEEKASVPAEDGQGKEEKKPAEAEKEQKGTEEEKS